MSSNWLPDDSLMKADSRGRVLGARRVVDALQKNGVRYGKGVITSRDKGVAAAQRGLKREGTPPGVESWQIPLVFRPTGDILSFMTRMKAGASVPTHSHDHAVVRVVLKGSLKYGRVTLKVGDWMFVPPGQKYAVTAGSDGCIILYGHGLPCEIQP
ncbi:MAG: cupin domain-containing protein [Candidatus Dormibacteraceae bacterium]